MVRKLKEYFTFIQIDVTPVQFKILIYLFSLNFYFIQLCMSYSNHLRMYFQYAIICSLNDAVKTILLIWSEKFQTI